MSEVFQCQQSDTRHGASEGVAANVQRIKGSIGYVEYAYAKQNKLTHTKMVNKDGKAVTPETASFQAAAASAATVANTSATAADTAATPPESPAADHPPAPGTGSAVALPISAKSGHVLQVPIEVVDAEAGITPADLEAAKILRRATAPVIVVSCVLSVAPVRTVYWFGRRMRSVSPSRTSMWLGAIFMSSLMRMSTVRRALPGSPATRWRASRRPRCTSTSSPT